jgi:hypothetical protein
MNTPLKKYRTILQRYDELLIFGELRKNKMR